MKDTIPVDLIIKLLQDGFHNTRGDELPYDTALETLRSL